MYAYVMELRIDELEMARRRAILTDREREMLQVPREERDDPHYVVISQVRTKIHDELAEDLEILRANHEALYDELREVVCIDD